MTGEAELGLSTTTATGNARIAVLVCDRSGGAAAPEQPAEDSEDEHDDQ